MILLVFAVVCMLYIMSLVLVVKEWTPWKEGFMENGKFVSKWYAISFYVFRTGFILMLTVQGLVIYNIYTKIIETL